VGLRAALRDPNVTGGTGIAKPRVGLQAKPHGLVRDPSCLPNLKEERC